MPDTEVHSIPGAAGLYYAYSHMFNVNILRYWQYAIGSIIKLFKNRVYIIFILILALAVAVAFLNSVIFSSMESGF
jgi:hypothetical protein